MQEDPFLKTIKSTPIDLFNFVLREKSKPKQRSALINLAKLNSHYCHNNISDAIFSDSKIFSKKNSVEWSFELYKMKNAIKNERSYKINYQITPYLTKHANDVFILAMISGHEEITSYFLTMSLINVNQSIYETSFWPSYFLLACTCNPVIFSLFKNQWINYNISWNGLTPYLLAYLNGNFIENPADLDFISYSQYQLLNEFRGIKLVDSDKPLPLFPLDFASMRSDRQQIKNILDENPEVGLLSRMSFIVQNEEHLILILSRFGFRTDQCFNGNTPLHFSCFNDNLSTFSILLYIDFPIQQNNERKFPNEVGSHKTREKASVFLNLCASIPTRKNVYERYYRTFSHGQFRQNISKWTEILKYKKDEYEKYIGFFKYLDFNKENRIIKKSRFNIINVFRLSKTSATVETAIQKMSKYPWYIRTYNSLELKKEYEKIFGDNL